jgi:hypothetical protein
MSDTDSPPLLDDQMRKLIATEMFYDLQVISQTIQNQVLLLSAAITQRLIEEIRQADIKEPLRGAQNERLPT